jgi:hypothetical protein
MCKNFKEKGVCKYGDKCLFAHGEHELTKKTPTEDKSKIVSTTEQLDEKKDLTGSVNLLKA